MSDEAKTPYDDPQIDLKTALALVIDAATRWQTHMQQTFGTAPAYRYAIPVVQRHLDAILPVEGYADQFGRHTISDKFGDAPGILS